MSSDVGSLTSWRTWENAFTSQTFCFLLCEMEGVSVTTSHHHLLRSSVVSDSLQPHGLKPARLLCHWDFPGKSTGVGCHFLLQGIFLTQGSNLGLLHGRWIPYQLSLHMVMLRNKRDIIREGSEGKLTNALFSIPLQ